MAQATILTQTRQYVLCPQCHEEHFIEHLMHGDVGFRGIGKDVGATTKVWWTCHSGDHRVEIILTRLEDGGIRADVTAEEIKPEHRRHEGLLLLRSANGDGTDPIYLVVKGSYLPDKADAEGASHQAYYYNEHTCPINWTSDVVAAIRNTKVLVYQQDDDPHGVFEYAGHMLKSDVIARLAREGIVLDDDDLDNIRDGGVRALFPRLFPDSNIIEGSLSAPGLPNARPILTAD